MATCGYICPLCEGKGFDEKGDDCYWCSTSDRGITDKKKEREKKCQSEDVKNWIENVHEGPCCGDL